MNDFTRDGDEDAYWDGLGERAGAIILCIEEQLGMGLTLVEKVALLRDALRKEVRDDDWAYYLIHEYNL